MKLLTTAIERMRRELEGRPFVETFAADLGHELGLDHPAPLPVVDGRLDFLGGRTLVVNGKPVAQGRLEPTVPLRFSTYAGMDIGRDNGEPVSPSYEKKSPFAFTGTMTSGRPNTSMPNVA